MWRAALCCWLALLLAGCGQRWQEGQMPAEERAQAEAFVQALAAGADTGFDPLGDERAAAQSRQAAGQAAAMLGEDWGPMRPLYHSAEEGGEAQSVHRYRIEGGERDLLLELVFAGRASDRRIVGWTMAPAERAAGGGPRFPLAGKGPVHYLMLALAVAVPALAIFAIARMLLTPGLEHRWLWVLGGLVGFGALGLDWASGALRFDPFHLMLLGVSFYSPQGADGWQIAVGLPLVALLFLLRGRWAKPQEKR